MRVSAYLLLLTLLAGCVQTAYLSCDDGNPCTFDAKVNGTCVYKPLSGPMEGCSGSGGCVEYGCFSGECIPQIKTLCCGNGACDSGESFVSCPRDCRPTCYDNLQNQGEEGIDCGGPCNSCESEDLNYLRKMGSLRGMWYDSAANYTSAVKRYNLNQNTQTMTTSAMESYGEIKNARDLLLKTTPPIEYAHLRDVLNMTMSVYLDAMNNMVLFMKFRDDKYRLESNRLFEDALDNDRAFVYEYNIRVDESNQVQTKCFNFREDDGEDGVDCGGGCRTLCHVVLNVTKSVTLRNEGGAAHISLNVSAPAIDYPPGQRLLGYYLDPIPEDRKYTDEGNLYYEYELDMPPYGVREFTITETIQLNRLPYPVKASTNYFNSIYLVENNLSQTTDDICFRARALKKTVNGTEQTVMKIEDWIIDNIRYELNQEEMGAEWCYINRKGACDEQADLFVSMARCDGIAARRLTGQLVNGSQLNGHAWSEYYDGNNWIYLDPSIKNRMQAFTLDNKHITACVGEGAYQCGIGYQYTYLGNMPKITVEEQVYLS